MARMNIKATNAEVFKMFPDLEQYHFIPTSTPVGVFNSGAILYKRKEGCWVIEGSDPCVKYALKEFLHKAKGGDRRLEEE